MDSDGRRSAASSPTELYLLATAHELSPYKQVASRTKHPAAAILLSPRPHALHASGSNFLDRAVIAVASLIAHTSCLCFIVPSPTFR